MRWSRRGAHLLVQIRLAVRGRALAAGVSTRVPAVPTAGGPGNHPHLTPHPTVFSNLGGIAQLTKSLAIAWAADNIRVNAVAPGWIATPLTQELQADPARTATLLARTPLKRWGRPEDVVGAVVFLCSPAAAFITGAIVPVDGGYLIS